MMLSKPMRVIIVVLFILWVSADPVGAGHVVHSVLSWVPSIFNGFITFINSATK